MNPKHKKTKAKYTFRMRIFLKRISHVYLDFVLRFFSNGLTLCHFIFDCSIATAELESFSSELKTTQSLSMDCVFSVVISSAFFSCEWLSNFVASSSSIRSAHEAFRIFSYSCCSRSIFNCKKLFYAYHGKNRNFIAINGRFRKK